MTSTKGEKSADIIPLRAAKASRAIEAKWSGPVVKLGFCVIPSLLLRAQQRLGLTPQQLVVLLQLCDHWWEANNKPFPSKEALSERIGLGERQIQRIIADLEDAGLVERIARFGTHGGKLSNTYDLSGLVKKLKDLEPEFREYAEEKREGRRNLLKPRYKRGPIIKKAAKKQPLETNT